MIGKVSCHRYNLFSWGQEGGRDLDQGCLSATTVRNRDSW